MQLNLILLSLPSLLMKFVIRAAVARAVTLLTRLFHELPYSPALHNMHLRSELMQKFSQSPVCSDVSLNELPRKCASR